MIMMLETVRRSPRLFALIAAILFFVAPATLSAAERFPQPEFETNYSMPDTDAPPSSRLPASGYIDLAALTVALGLSAFFSLKYRRRNAIFALMVVCLLYFGFYRQGCVCPIGAIQNVTLALFKPEYSAPLTDILFFLLPIAAALLVGRVFCGAACPLGALQDLVIFRPVKVPAPLDRALGMIPVAFLAIAILLASVDAEFIICALDPFVGFFRFSGPLLPMLLGVFFLLIGTVVARPYCRYLCPYGVILNACSTLSRWKVRITPDRCVACKLCEDSCPFGAIEKPVKPLKLESRRSRGVRFGLYLALIPIAALIGGFIGSQLADPLALRHHTVSTAHQIDIENRGLTKVTTDASDAFRETGQSVEALFSEAKAIRQTLRSRAWLIGGIVGAIFALQIAALFVRVPTTDYEPHRGRCLSCGRCFDYCPFERARRDGVEVETR